MSGSDGALAQTERLMYTDSNDRVLQPASQFSAARVDRRWAEQRVGGGSHITGVSDLNVTTQSTVHICDVSVVGSTEP